MSFSLASAVRARKFQKVLLKHYMVSHGNEMNGVIKEDWGKEPRLLTTDQMSLLCTNIGSHLEITLAVSNPTAQTASLFFPLTLDLLTIVRASIY